MPKYVRIALYILFVVVYVSEPYNIYDGMFLACFRKYFYVAVIAIGMSNFLLNPDAIVSFKKKKVLKRKGNAF